MTSSPTLPTCPHTLLGARDWGSLIAALCPITPPFPHSAEALAQHRIMGFSPPPSAKLIAPWDGHRTKPRFTEEAEARRKGLGS